MVLIKLYAELFNCEVDKLRPMAAAVGSNFCTPGKAQFFLRDVINADIRMISGNVKDQLNGQFVVKNTSDALVLENGTMLRMNGAKIIGNKPSVLVLSQIVTIERAEVQSRYDQTPYLGSYVAPMVDDCLKIPANSKFVICDVEHTTLPTGTDFKTLCPLAAYAVVEGERIVKYKTFLTPEGCEGRASVKAQAALSHILINDQGNQETFAYNGGIIQWRKDIVAYYEQGYEIIAKGALAEASVLADYGVTVKTRRLAMPVESTGSYAGQTQAAYVRARNESVGPNGYPVVVTEMYGKPYDKIKEHYMPCLTVDLYQEIFQTGYCTLHHHPLAEVYIFAKHILLNKYSKMMKTRLNSKATLALQQEFQIMVRAESIFTLADYLQSIYPFPREIGVKGASLYLVRLVEKHSLNLATAQIMLEEHYPNTMVSIQDILAINPSVFQCYNGVLSFTMPYFVALEWWHAETRKPRTVTLEDLADVIEQQTTPVMDTSPGNGEMDVGDSIL